MGTPNPVGKAGPAPEEEGRQEEAKHSGWVSWWTHSDPKDVPQGTEGQQAKPPAGSKVPAETKAERAWTPEEREAWRESPFQMATQGGAQAPTLRKSGLSDLIKPGQLDGSRPEPSPEEPDKDGEQERFIGPVDTWGK